MGVDAANIEQAAAFDDGDTTFGTIPALGSGYVGLPSNGDDGGPGVDQGVDCAGFTNGSNSVLANTHYTTTLTLASSIDLSAVDSAAWLYIRNTSVNPSFNHLATTSDAIQIIYFSGGALVEFGVYNFSGNVGLQSGIFQEMKTQGAPDSETASFDISNITSVVLAFKTDGSPTVFGFQWGIDQMIYHSGPVQLINDVSPGAVSLDDYFEFFAATSGNSVHMLNTFERASFAYEIGFPVDFRCDELVTGASALGLGFKPDNGRGWINTPSGYYQILMTPPASSTQELINTTFATTTSDVPVTLDASNAGASITIAPLLVAGVSDFSVLGNVTITGGTITSPDSVTLNSGTLDLTIDDCLIAVQLTGVLDSGSSLTITNPQATVSLRLSIDPSDLTTTTITVPTSDVIVEPTTTGTYDLTTLFSAGTVTFDNIVATSDNVTITHAATLTALVASPEAGSGTITLETPAVVFNATSSGLRSNSRLQIINETGKLSPTWTATTAYTVDTKAIRTLGVGIELISGLYFVVQDGGTSGGSEPAWDLTPGNTTADGSVTWVTRSVNFVNDFQAVDLSTTYTDGVEFINGDTARVRATFADGTDYELPFESRVVVNNGIGAVINQEPWLDVEAIGIDGSPTGPDMVTEFSTDFSNLQIDIMDPDGLTTKTRFVAFHAFSIYDSDIAIDVFFGAVTVLDQANFRIEVSVSNLKFENLNTAPVLFNDPENYMFASDGSTLIAATSNSIQIDNGRVNIDEANIRDIRTRLDLTEGTPNTYQKNSTGISNDDYTLTEVSISATEFRVDFVPTP